MDLVAADAVDSEHDRERVAAVGVAPDRVETLSSRRARRRGLGGGCRAPTPGSARRGHGEVAGTRVLRVGSWSRSGWDEGLEPIADLDDAEPVWFRDNDAASKAKDCSGWEV